MKRKLAVALCSLFLLLSVSAIAEEPPPPPPPNPYEGCLVDALNRFTVMDIDSAWILAGVPVFYDSYGDPIDMLTRVRVVCSTTGKTLIGWSDYFSPNPFETTDIYHITLGTPPPLFERITLSLSKTELQVGETTQASVQGLRPSGEVVDATSRSVGTTYGSSNKAIAITDQTGLVTAVSPGFALVWARNETLISTVMVRVLDTGDRDGDGMPDAYESSVGLNPDDPTDAALDPDADGLTNLQEYLNSTNPFAADTDGDGLNDGYEVIRTQTSPLLADSDNDGVGDAEEDPDDDGLTNAEEFPLGTDPRSSDTDRDGFADGMEVALGSNPLDPHSIPTISVNFDTSRNFPAAVNPATVAKGDFNLDGHLDIAVASLGSFFLAGGTEKGEVKIYLGTGHGGFSIAQTLEVGVGPSGIAVGDLTGDGKPDLVVTSVGDAVTSGGSVPCQVHILRGLGNGTFTESESVAIGLLPRSPVLGDFNGDGALDIAVADSGLLLKINGDYFFGTGSNTITVILGDGAGGILDVTQFNCGTNPYALVARDFDGDGVLDLAAGTFSADVRVMKGDGAGNFTQISRVRVGVPLDLLAEDFDGDGVPDIAVDTITEVKTLKGDGAGGMTLEVVLSTPQSTSGLFGGDLTGDGVADLGALQGPNAVLVFPGLGNGSFGSLVSTITGFWARAGVSGDFDEDGKLDVVTANEGGSNISLLLGKGGGEFSHPREFPAAGATDFASSDLDGDGHLDFVYLSGPQFYILWGDGTGSFTEPGYSRGISGWLNDVEVGDFNADGRKDLVFAVGKHPCCQQGGFWVVLGRGGREFNASYALWLAQERSGRAVAAGDFTGDGRLDLAVAFMEDDGTGVVGIAKGDPAQTFVMLPTLKSSGGNWPSDIAVADLNRDGALDVVVANAGGQWGSPSGGTVNVLFGDGHGGLSEPVEVARGSSPFSVSVTDFNGDGAPEIVVPFSGSVGTSGGGGLDISGTPRGVQVLMNDGLGSFTALPLIAEGSAPTDAILADLNRDGVKDIAFSDIVGTQVSVYLGGGSNQFFGPASFLTNLGPYRIVVGDFNEDSKPDLATSNSYARSISVLLNTGGSARLEGQAVARAGPEEGSIVSAVATWVADLAEALFHGGRPS